MNPQKHIRHQLENLAVELADVGKDFEPLEIVRSFGKGLVVQHSNHLQQ